MTVTHSHVECRNVGGRTFAMSLHGDFDLYTAPELSADFTRLLDRGARVIVVDLAGATFVDSTTLGVLVEARKEVIARGGRMILASPGDVMRRILEQTGLDELFDVTDGSRSGTNGNGWGRGDALNGAARLPCTDSSR